MFIIDLRNKLVSEYRCSVINNSNVDELHIYSHFTQYANYSIYLKVRSVDGDYVDKIAIASENITIQDDALLVKWLMGAVSTQCKRIEIQLQFEQGETIVAQSRIVSVILGDTINVSNEIAPKYPDILRHLQAQIDELNLEVIKSGSLTYADDTLNLILKNKDNNNLVSLQVQIPLSEKVNIIREINKIYGTNGQGEQVSYSVSESANANTIPLRNANGEILVSLPISLGGATPKSYTDTFAKTLVVSIDENYVLNIQLKDANNNVLATQDVDLPLEEMIVDATYDNTNKTIVFTLKNGQTLNVPVADLVSGLVSNDDLSAILENYYTKVEIDTELDKKANVDGNYPTMTTGNADNLTPYGKNSGVEDTTPFVFQTAGGSSDIGSQAYLKALRGNSVAFNQLVQNGNFADNSGWFAQGSLATISIANNVATTTKTSDSNCLIAYKANADVSLVINHKYLAMATIKPSGTSSVHFRISAYGSPKSLTANVKNFISDILTPTSISGIYFGIEEVTPLATGGTYEIENAMLFDLTLMFGEGNEPTTVEEFTRMFTKPYYEYNAGELISSKVNGIKNVGYNAFDGSLKQGDPSGSQNHVVSSTNFIKVISGQKYILEATSSVSVSLALLRMYDANGNEIKYVSATIGGTTINQEYTIADNATLVKIQFNRSSATDALRPSDLSNVCLHLKWDGSRTGYEPYDEHVYPLPNIELRSAGSAYDELKHDGTLIRRIGVVDLGSLDGWVSAGIDRDLMLNANALADLIKKPATDSVIANISCSKYTRNTVGNVYSKNVDMSICISATGRIYIYDSGANITSSSTEEQIKAYLSGVYLFYELAEPTEEQNDDYKFQEVQDIDDFGTQEFLYDNDIDIPVPQGNDFFYPVDYKAFIDSFGGREDIDYDASQIVSHSELQVSEAQRDTIDNQLKEALGGTLRNVLAVKESLDFNDTDYIDISLLAWTKQTGYTASATGLQTLIEKPSAYNVVAKALCSKYKVVAEGNIASPNKSFAFSTGGVLLIKDTALDSLDADGIKNAMKGVLLAYKKA